MKSVLIDRVCSAAIGFLTHRPIAIGLLIVALATGSRASVSAETSVPITSAVWQEAVLSVTDIDRSAEFFLDIGGYEVRWRGALERPELDAWNLPATASGEAMLIGPESYTTGLIRLVRFDNAGRREPMRPGSRAWDTGCYFSLMVRTQGMQAIYDDAIRMGWWTETPITFLEFGTSKLNVAIFRGPDGIQVQGYERLEPPLPAAIPPFERLTGPFNMMQMVRDRDRAYAFFTDVLGFETFYNGKPFTEKTPTHMPLGIPVNLTTTVPYRAGIVYPQQGEFGRMEMIEIMGLEGRDHAARCEAPNLGILSVRFPVADIEIARAHIDAHDWPVEIDTRSLMLAPYGAARMFAVKTPDGAIVQFYELLAN